MHGGEWIPVAIVAIVMIAGIFKARMKYEAQYKVRPEHSAENQRLRDEVKTLKDRVAVLERIATDRGNLLEQEIEQLRDR